MVQSLLFDLRKKAKVLFVVDGKLPPEIGDEINVRHGTVRMWRSRGGWDKLREEYLKCPEKFPIPSDMKMEVEIKKDITKPLIDKLVGLTSEERQEAISNTLEMILVRWLEIEDKVMKALYEGTKKGEVDPEKIMAVLARNKDGKVEMIKAIQLLRGRPTENVAVYDKAKIIELLQNEVKPIETLEAQVSVTVPEGERGKIQ